MWPSIRKDQILGMNLKRTRNHNGSFLIFADSQSQLDEIKRRFDELVKSGEFFSNTLTLNAFDPSFDYYTKQRKRGMAPQTVAGGEKSRNSSTKQTRQ